jgi:hypothetical protein
MFRNACKTPAFWPFSTIKKLYTIDHNCQSFKGFFDGTMLCPWQALSDICGEAPERRSIRVASGLILEN